MDTPGAAPNLHHEPPSRGSAAGSPQSRSLEKSLERIQITDPGSIRLGLFPDFLILGPQRTGSTWLYHNLKKHPQIFLPREKETYYFTTLGRSEHPHYRFDALDDFLTESMRDTSRRWIKKQYDCLRKQGKPYRPIVRGEATATNALLPVSVIREITRIRPGLKAILMLRDPVERAWSHARKDLVVKTRRRPDEIPAEEFERFFRASGQRALADYAGLIRRWSTRLEPGHLFVGEFKKIASAPEELLTAIHRFLGVHSGPDYFNRHLRERINTAAHEPPSRIVPAKIRERLKSLLEKEIRQFHRLESAPAFSAFHRAIRNHPIPPTASRPKPGSKRPHQIA